MQRALYALLPLGVACAPSDVPHDAPPMYDPPQQVVALLVDGVPFDLGGCIPGATSGFHGAELQSSGGARIRLVSEVDGASKVVVFRAGADRGVVLSECSRIEMTESRTRSSTSVKGRASIDCDEQGVRIVGTVLLERCSG